MSHCPTCGAEVSEGAEFCPDCGTDLNAASTDVTESASPTPSTPSPEPSAPEAAAAMPEAPPAAGPELTPEAGTAPTPVPTSAAGGAARLTLKRGGALTSEVFPIAGRVIVGRFDLESGPVDVDLGPLPESSYVSRHHAELWTDDSGQWLIRDLGSRNGTFHRAAGQGQFRRIDGEQALADGDEIALGNARFELRTR